MGLPLPPLTATVTVNGWVVLMLDGVGVTVTVGAAGCAVSPTVGETLEL